MPSTVDTFLHQARLAADVLQEPELVDLIAIVDDQARATGLSVMVVGSTGAGRCSTANVLIGDRGLLPVSAVPKPPISLRVSYGEVPSARARRIDGTVIPVPIEDFRSFLIGAGDRAAEYDELQIEAKCSLLAHAGLRIESLDAQRDDDQWRALLAATDYTIMVLNATALLSQRERQFLRDQLDGQFGLERVALVINQMDLIPAEEHPSIQARVRAFLGPLQGKPAIIEFSAAQAWASLTDDQMSPGTGFEELVQLVAHDLIVSTEALRSASVAEGARLILATIEDGAARRRSTLSMSREDLQRQIEALDLQSQSVQSGVARARARVRLYVETWAKERLLREIEAFNIGLREQLPEEILSVEDLGEIKRHLPGYIEALWTEFLERQWTLVRTALIRELQRVEEMVQQDLGELLGENASILLGHSLENPCARLVGGRPLLMPKRGRQLAPFLASALQFGGLVVWLGGGGLPGIAALGVGQIVRMVTREGVMASQKQAVVASTMEALPELEGRIKARVERHFATLAEELDRQVSDLYGARLAEMRSALEESLEGREELLARSDDLESLVKVTIPELKAMLDELTEREVEA